MAPSPLSPQARTFLADHVHSVMQLELLLLIRNAPKGRTALDASRELRAPLGWVTSQLVAFAARGVMTSDDASAPVFSLVVGGPDANAVAELAHAYDRRRTTIIRLIFARPDRDVASSSDGITRRAEDDA